MATTRLRPQALHHNISNSKFFYKILIGVGSKFNFCTLFLENIFNINIIIKLFRIGDFREEFIFIGYNISRDLKILTSKYYNLNF